MNDLYNFVATLLHPTSLEKGNEKHGMQLLMKQWHIAIIILPIGRCVAGKLSVSHCMVFFVPIWRYKGCCRDERSMGLHATCTPHQPRKSNQKPRTANINYPMALSACGLIH